MSPRCYRNRCAKKVPRYIISLPRPCIDSLHLPVDFYLPHHSFYPPPCYDSPIISHEYICECPNSPTENSDTSLHCTATNNVERRHALASQNGANKILSHRRAQVPYTPSINEFAERPPNYQNDSQMTETFVSNHNRQRYVEQTDGRQQINIEENEYIPYPRGAYQQMSRTQEKSGYREQRTIEPYPDREAELSKGMEQNNIITTQKSSPGVHNSQRLFNNNDVNFDPPQNVTSEQVHPQHDVQGLPPQYIDAIDLSPPNYSFPPSACCNHSSRFSELRELSSSERTPSPYNMTQNKSPVQGGSFQQSHDHRRNLESTPDLIRRAPIDSEHIGSHQSTQHLPNRNTTEYGSEPSPCCANAFGRKKNDKPPPPVPKGMSGAHRPGFVFNEDTYDFSASNKSGCMSSIGSSCSHGISSIMPDITTPKLKEKASSTGMTCSYKEITGKRVKHKISCKKEAGTDACDSATCLANRNRFCPCRYPPSFKQFSCVGNITGSCKCNEQRFQ